MSTPMDIDPPAAAPAENSSVVEEVKGKGKEEKPRFEVKKVHLLTNLYQVLTPNVQCI